MMRNPALLLAALLCGCTTQADWIRQDTTDQQRNADFYACERDIRVMLSPGPSLFRSCMAAKGYTH